MLEVKDVFCGQPASPSPSSPGGEQPAIHCLPSHHSVAPAHNRQLQILHGSISKGRRRPQRNRASLKPNMMQCVFWITFLPPISVLNEVQCGQNISLPEISSLNWRNRFRRPVHIFSFLPDPGVSGVRSMGPGLSMSVRELFETLLM